jgi:hypothetical protein
MNPSPCPATPPDDAAPSVASSQPGRRVTPTRNTETSLGRHTSYLAPEEANLATSEQKRTMGDTPGGLTRAERLALAAAAVRGILGGAIRALLDAILDHH